MTATPVHEHREVPATVGDKCTFAGPDYADCFTLTTFGAAPGTPESWARAAFEDVAGFQGQLIFRCLIGLRLRWRRSAGHVAGWRVDGHGDDWIRLAARGPLMDGQLLLVVDGDQVSLGTFMRYHRGPGRAIWTRLSAVHRSKAAWLLRETLARQV